MVRKHIVERTKNDFDVSSLVVEIFEAKSRVNSDAITMLVIQFQTKMCLSHNFMHGFYGKDACHTNFTYANCVISILHYMKLKSEDFIYFSL